MTRALDLVSGFGVFGCDFDWRGLLGCGLLDYAGVAGE